MRARVLLVLIGVVVLAYGVDGLVRHAGATRPVRWVAELVGVSLFHDLVLVPVVLAVLVVSRRLLPPSWRAPAAAFLLVGGCLALVAVPVLVRSREPGRYPSLLPRDYGSALAIALATALATVLAVVLVPRVVRRARRGIRR